MIYLNKSYFSVCAVKESVMVHSMKFASIYEYPLRYVVVKFLNETQLYKTYLMNIQYLVLDKLSVISYQFSVRLNPLNYGELSRMRVITH